MTMQIPPSDWELLSAYLDNELSPRERTQVEARLKASAELRQGLSELRQVRHTLRSQPRLRAPRNFTLTPQMAGVRPGVRPGGLLLPPAYPMLRLASVLATIFFVLITAGSLYVRSYGPAPRPVALSQPQDLAAQEARPFGMGGGGGGGGGAVEPPMPASRTLTESVTLEAARPAGDEPTAQALAAPVLEVTPEAAPEAALEAGNEGPAMQLEAPNAKIRPGIAAAQSAQDPTALEQEIARQEQARKLAWAVLTAAQVLLALLAVGAGAAAIYLRLAARR